MKSASTVCAAGASVGAAGLVSSKTSGRTVSLSKICVAQRRVNRLKKSVWASGHLHGLPYVGFRPPTCWFVTLTYKGVNDWQPRHISDALKGYRRWCDGRGVPCRYVWVAELQSRGAVHYHLLAWLPQGVRMPKWDRRTVAASGRRSPSWWPHGMTNREPAKSGVGYLMKYLSKLGELITFPPGLRLYGVGGLDGQARAVRRWLNWPEWLKNEFGVGDVIKRGRDWVQIATGEIVPPAFRVLRIPDGLCFLPLRVLPERFHDGVYSTWRAAA